MMNRRLSAKHVFPTIFLLANCYTSQASALVLNAPRSASGEVVFWNYEGSVPYRYDVYSNTYNAGLSTSPNTPNPGELQLVLEYDLNTLFNSPVTVTSATLSVVRGQIPSGCLGLDPCPTPDGLSVYSYAGDGLLSTDDFDAGNLLSTLVLPVLGTVMNFDVTSLIAGFVDGSDRYAGFNLRVTSDGAVNLYSTGTGVFMVPKLEINYVEGSGGNNSIPEPTTLALLGIGIAGLAISRRRSKSH